PANAGDPMGLALYAFDGTWNHRLRMVHTTNVDLLMKAYVGTAVYEPGVGTDDIFGNQIACGLTGCGGAARIDDAMENLERLWNSGDQQIDIVGFSRGAAEAREFANRIVREGVFDTRLGRRVVPRIRFLGLFDTVGSFGWPGNRANFGYELSIPLNVEKVRQAVAADERRGFFPLSSIKEFEGQENTDRATERYFTGSHSDCGGGYEDDARLAERSLYWMWQEAVEAGVPLAPWEGSPPERASIGASPSGERFCVPTVHDSRNLLDHARDAIAWFLGGRVHRTVYYYPRSLE
ncbi:MAG: DUF2235 domain-containing protein, partial [Thermoanaerobaculia bacterium]